MASIASSSSNTTGAQADPLPIKRGEIGFQPEVHEPIVSQEDTDVPPPQVPTQEPPNATLTTESNNDTPLPVVPDPITSSLPLPKEAKPKFTCLFRKEDGKARQLGGVNLSIIARLLAQLAFLTSTTIGWVVLVQRLNTHAQSTSSPFENSVAGQAGSGSIFLHVAFGIATLAQLLFLERTIYHIRAQRFCYAHPNVLPTHNRPSIAEPVLGLAPWNRPPLPTYAAALAQSGHGTGDVEDNAIAVPPPPAYGHTRGSVLLLSGHLRDSLRRTMIMEGRVSIISERPQSYSSQSDQCSSSIEQDSAMRQIRVEETLARLEDAHLSQ